MSAEHKAALARGREEGRAVRRYLDALEQQKPRRGRRRTPESIQKRLAVIAERLPEVDSLTRLHLIQEQADLTAELKESSPTDNLAVLERAFVKVARSYSERKGIGYAAWRAAGVSAQVLDRAGVSRTDRH
jgi:hypothetical protein